MPYFPAQHILTHLQQRGCEGWAVGCDNVSFHRQTQDFFAQFSRPKISPTLLLAESDPFRFLAAFIAAVGANCPLFLGNPNWGTQEWQQVLSIVGPDRVLRDGTQHSFASKNKPEIIPGAIAIPTGGTSGTIRFALHTWETLTASVEGFYQYFDGQPVNSFCLLPLYHVSGLMQFLRSFLTGGTLHLLPYGSLKAGNKGQIQPEEFFISLVPTQLQDLLQLHPRWLSCFHTVLLGGAPAWKPLLEAAREYNIRLAPTYGMTETASQIVTLKPDDFLGGNNSNGCVLPHAKVSLGPEGAIAIEAKSLCLGYYPPPPTDGTPFRNSRFFTDDLGYFDDRGHLQILGRNSHKIITGGENVFPAEVEAAILATQLVKDVCVIGVKDDRWGQAIAAVCVPQESTLDPKALETALKGQISPFKRPKHWICLPRLPRNGQGKIRDRALRQIVEEAIQ